MVTIKLKYFVIVHIKMKIIYAKKFAHAYLNIAYY